MDYGYRDSKLKEYIGKRIPVTAIYEIPIGNLQFDNGSKHVLLTDVRNVGGDLLRNHVWSHDAKVFKSNTHLEKGSIIQFDGLVSKYVKGIKSNTIDYTIKDISNVRIIGNRLSSREMCDSCDYKIRTKGLESKIEDYRNTLNKMINKDSYKFRNESELKRTIEKLEEKNMASTKAKQSLTMKNSHLTKLMNELYLISKRKNVRDVERLKLRMETIIGKAINCRKCNRKLNKCKCKT